MTSRALIAVLGGLLALVILGLLGLTQPASAQSKRYPPEPVDKDAEQAAKSKLWSAAITPERHPYDDLVHAADQALGQRTNDQKREAIKKLDEAILLLPREPRAYRLRGKAHFELQDWTNCAADFAAANVLPQRDDEPLKDRIESQRTLGLCQARAGKLSDAEKTLAEVAASGNATGEIWMRLGEVRIAMGKLDEAIAALKSAIAGTTQSGQALMHFMLAAAYDRARRPADALIEVGEGIKVDQELSTLHNPSVAPLGAGEFDYMLGLAHSADPPRPEYALAYFRRFVKAAPDSPWRKRAEEHIRDLKAVELPDTIKRLGTAPLDLDAARAIARRAMPQMRACLAKFPAAVVEVHISRAGPRTPTTDRMRPRFFSPPDNVTVRSTGVGELTDTELEVVDRCISPLATRLALPAIKERDTYYRATFYVVGP